MGGMSKGIMPVCDSLCVCCPGMRPRSRHPVKRYKNLLADIFPKNLVSAIWFLILVLDRRSSSRVRGCASGGLFLSGSL